MWKRKEREVVKTGAEEHLEEKRLGGRGCVLRVMDIEGGGWGTS